MAAKKEIRQRLLAMRSACPKEERTRQSADIARQVLAHPAYHSCGTLFSYVPFRQEVDTWPVMRTALAEGKTVAVPKVEGREIPDYRGGGSCPGKFRHSGTKGELSGDMASGRGCDAAARRSL